MVYYFPDCSFSPLRESVETVWAAATVLRFDLAVLSTKIPDLAKEATAFDMLTCIDFSASYFVIENDATLPDQKHVSTKLKMAYAERLILYCGNRTWGF